MMHMRLAALHFLGGSHQTALNRVRMGVLHRVTRGKPGTALQSTGQQ